VIRETFPVGLLGCNCSILGDEISHEAIVVDPGYDIPRILTVLAKHQLTVKTIFITHAHIDHIASAQSLKAITGAPILYNQADLPLVAIMVYTPGHSEGSVCLYIPSQSLLLAGDTLFAGGVGRTDFPGGSAPKLMRSIQERLLTLPDATLVVPGHGAETSIGIEREHNPFLS
jgi:hydroxyacylglutathione hydrolase